jgi:glucosamine--fructose-6-phosphate aminotransferase (isomerizing)
MCGIFGIVTQDEQELGPILIEAGKRLSYRGYDSVGCATLGHNQRIDLRKDIGKVDEVAEKHNFHQMYGTRGIIQLRWATFGHPSQANAQPHIDSDGDIVGAHNGNVVNNFELREQFIAEGMNVRSDNDGETCVHAVERYVDKEHNVLEAIRYAYNDLAGDYSFLIGRVGEDKLYAIKKGSGLSVGIGDGFTCISSDLPSILPLTRQVIRIMDGEIVTLKHNKIEIHRVADGQLIERQSEFVEESMETVQKGGYPHFMLKEIHEQAKVAEELLHLLEKYPELNNIIQRVSSARNLYLIGCGTSYHACLLGSIYFSQIAGRTAIPVLAPQFAPQFGQSLSEKDVGVFVSQSGETKDVLNAIGTAQQHGMGILGLVNVIGSSLTQISEHYLPLTCGYEISVPATKTYFNQALVFLYMAMRMGGHSTYELLTIPELIQRTLSATEHDISKIARDLADKEDLYCLGYGLTYPVALEGALKLKEITYAHCEGMLSTEFKHGPLSAVRDGYPVLFIAGPDNTSLLVSGINEVTCRGGRAIAFGEEDERLRANAHELIVLPKTNSYISALLSVLPLQLLSYQMSVLRGYDPDFPRNLSKTLTVD